MTSTDTIPSQPSPAAQHRVLRRSRTDRVGAGVAGGLGEYFGVDPVLFRVLFATAAFFGGAGILAYLLAWAAIPEAGTRHAPIDGWIRRLRRRRISAVLLVLLGVVVLWAMAFSWWAPGPLLPVMLVVVALFLLFMRRETTDSTEDETEPVDLTKPVAAVVDEPDATGTPTWVGETRQWLVESREAHRVRRRRAMPLRLATLCVLIVALTVLGLIDAASGIQLRTYFFVTAGIVAAALLLGLALRRTPWVLSILLIPALLGSIAYGGTTASLHDGSGQRNWTPTTTLPGSYRLAFGEGILDLRSLQTPETPRTVHVTMAGGRLRIIAPKTMNLVVDAHLRFGEISVDGVDRQHGSGVYQTIEPLAGHQGAQITIDARLATGQITVDHD
jgi:phage shock protein PspC (stress-responsive transcriptional regulator)/FtsH-binding integral membrane protein